MKTKTRYEHDPSLRRPGKFTFTVDNMPEFAVIKVDGVVVKPDDRGVVELEGRPRLFSGIVIERCAGPHYTPPVRWFLAQAALLKGLRS